MDVPNVIVENTFLDWKKKDVDKEQRSLIIKSYLKERNISQRELARELEVNHSTLQDWVNPKEHKTSVVKMIFPKKLMIYSLANRINYLLNKEVPKDEKTLKELNQLKNLLNEII